MGEKVSKVDAIIFARMKSGIEILISRHHADEIDDWGIVGLLDGGNNDGSALRCTVYNSTSKCPQCVVKLGRIPEIIPLKKKK